MTDQPSAPELHYAEEGPGEWFASLQWDNHVVDAWGPTRDHAVGLAFEKLGRFLLKEARSTHPAPPPTERNPPIPGMSDEQGITSLEHRLATDIVMQRFFNNYLEQDATVQSFDHGSDILVVHTLSRAGRLAMVRKFVVGGNLTTVREVPLTGVNDK